MVAPSLRLMAQATGRAARQFRPRKAALVMTDRAVDRVKELLEKRHKEYLRLGVKTRGCNGMSYTLNYADGPTSRLDEVVEDKGVKVIIEPSALMHVLGTEMDFITDRLRAEFVFNNPNAKGVCGCGESFTTGKQGGGSGTPASGGADSGQDESGSAEDLPRADHV